MLLVGSLADDHVRRAGEELNGLPPRATAGAGDGLGLAAALDAVESRVADAPIVAKLDRLSRSLLDFATLMERSRRRGWALVALDLGVDTTTPQGELMATVLASFAQYERRLIGIRTREALARKRAVGIRLGRPRALDDDTIRLISGLRAEGRRSRQSRQS